jgi:general secretion pathway protein D
MKRKLVWMLIVLAAAVWAFPALAADQLPAKPVDQVTLDVRGLDVDNLLQFYSRTFGLTVIKDPNLTGAVTIMCPQPVSRQQAFDILNSVLEVRGFTSLLQGNVLKIVPLSKAVQSNVGVTVGRSSTQEGDQVVTQVVPIKNAVATQLQADLTPLISTGATLIANSSSNTLTITDYASNISRILRVIEQIDSEQAAEVRVFPLVYAPASDVAQVLTQVFFTQAGASTRQGMGPPGFLQRLMGATAAASGGRGLGTGAPVGQAVADARTNSVIVTASKDRIAAVGDVIKSLDKPVEYEGTLAVVHLERANAQEVANSLNQALGGRTARQTTTTTAAARRTGQTTRTTPSTRQRTQTRQAPAVENAQPSKLGEATLDPAGQEPAESSGGSVEVAQVPQAGAARTQTSVGRGPEGEIINVLEAAGNVSVVAEPNTNSLIITAPPEYVDMVNALIRELDQAPPQVLIEAIVAEVSLTGDRKLGFEWAWTEKRHFGQENTTGTLGTGFGLSSEDLGFRYTVAGASLDTLLHALVTDNKVTILSTPRIFTSNNRAAEINISTQTPYVSTVRTSDITQTFSVDYLDVGVILQVTPQISPDGTVTMQVVQEANELLGYEQFGTDVKAPTIARRSAEATIQVADGQTVILGGIIRDNSTRSVSKVPLLGDLPLLGGLFRRSTITKEKTELIVLLTPRVVRTKEEAAALTQSEKEKASVRLPAAPKDKGEARPK